MKVAIVALLWLLLFVLAWPVALAALVLVPFFWVISLPIRLIVWIVEACLLLLRTILFLPARLLGAKSAD